MNFTREPIIETIISPKEGCKLLVRRSKGDDAVEEHYVDAIEVVSFGRAFFFRSMERPKAFLVPVSDYEVVEVKEPRVALKTASHERNIKIGGGRDAPLRQSQKEPSTESEAEPAFVVEEASSTEEEGESSSLFRTDKRRDRRRRRHRRSPEDQERPERKPLSQEFSSSDNASQAQGGGGEVKVTPPVMPILIPPPTTLISQTLGRYKGKEFMEGRAPAKEEKKSNEPPAEQASSTPKTLIDSKEASSDLGDDFYPF